MERSFLKYLPLVGFAILLAFGVKQILQRRRSPRSFRESPIGALKDRGGLFADRAQEMTDETLTRLQSGIDEIRGRLPEFNHKRRDRTRKAINRRLTFLADQTQDLLKELQASKVFSR